MHTLGSVLDALNGTHPSGIEVLVGSRDTEVTDVATVESPDHLSELAPGCLVLLDRQIARSAESYRFDILVRKAHGLGLAGFVLTLPDEIDVSITALALAEKAGFCLVRLDGDVDLLALIRTMAQHSAGDLHLSVERARQTCAGIADPRTATMTVPELIALGSRLLGTEIRLGPRPVLDAEAVVAVPAEVTDQGGDWLITARRSDVTSNTLVEMTLWRLAAEVTRATQRAARGRQLFLQSAGEVLLRLIESDRSTRTDLAVLARRVGIPVDAWHVVGYLHLDNLLEISDGDIASFSVRNLLIQAVLDHVSAAAGTWHIAHDPSTLIVLQSQTSPPRRLAGPELHRRFERIIEAMVAAVPRIRVFGGVGTQRAGLAGLASSASEARLALTAARSTRRHNTARSFDSIGMRTTLVEWYSSPTVQESVNALFAPLAELSPARQDALMETVLTYLDSKCSIMKTSELMHLHRNAVRHRLQRAFEMLRIDEEDPDQRLFLHLACRARRPGVI